MKKMRQIKYLVLVCSMLLGFSGCVSTLPKEHIEGLYKEEDENKEMLNEPTDTIDWTDKLEETSKEPEATEAPAEEMEAISLGEEAPPACKIAYDEIGKGVPVQGTETVKPLPMGTFVEVDLDGDGTAEKVTVAFFKEGETIGKNNVWEGGNAPTIFINDMVFDAGYLENTLMLYMESADVATWYLFDVDTEDNYMEIGLYEAGPSNDPYTTLFRYQEGELRKIGGFSDNPIDAEVVYINETQDYQTVLDSVDRSQIQIIVPGDGKIYGRQRLDILETNFAEGMWELLNSESFEEASLEVQLREVYQFIGFGQREEEYCPKVAAALQLYMEPNVLSEMFDLEVGQIVDFYDYYPIGDGGWVQVVYNNYKSVGWIFVRNHFEIYQLNEEGEGIYIPSYDLFADLCMAD